MSSRPSRTSTRSSSALDSSYDRFPKDGLKRESPDDERQQTGSPLAPTPRQASKRSRSSRHTPSPGKTEVEETPRGPTNDVHGERLVARAVSSKGSDSLTSSHEGEAANNGLDDGVDDADYEAERMKRMKENAELLASLGLNVSGT